MITLGASESCKIFLWIYHNLAFDILPKNALFDVFVGYSPEVKFCSTLIPPLRFAPNSNCLLESIFLLTFIPFNTVSLIYHTSFFLCFSLTVILTGLRSPALTKASSSSVWVAENNPYNNNATYTSYTAGISQVRMPGTSLLWFSVFSPCEKLTQILTGKDFTLS